MQRQAILAGLGTAIVLGLAAPAALAQTTGYLSPDRTPRAGDFLAPPPADGSPQSQSDHQVYAATRALKDGPRWILAQGDADIDPRGAARLFDCAIGARLAEPEPPAVARLLTRVLLDVSASYNPAKDLFKRPRPPVGNDLPICVPRDKRTLESFSYPSGHGAISWAWALVLSEAEPDRAAAILRRGQAIGDSRVACGVHYPSDIQAGRLVGAAVVAADHNSAEFAADLKAAKLEIDALRAKGGENPVCAAETSALSIPVY